MASSPAIAAGADTTRDAGREKTATEEAALGQNADAPPSKRQKAMLSPPAKSNVAVLLNCSTSAVESCHAGLTSQGGLDNASDQAEANSHPQVFAEQVDLQQAGQHACEAQWLTNPSVLVSTREQEQQAAAAASTMAPLAQDRHASKNGPFT